MTENNDKELIAELKRRLDERNQNLEDLKVLNQQLLEVNKKLSESEALKSHFLSNISNEIVNPFTAIVGLASNIAGMESADMVSIRNMASLIYAEAFHLDFQLKNIFMAANLEAGESTPEYARVNISELLENLVSTYQIDLNNKQLNLFMDVSEDICFPADPEKLELILANVLNNAILFSPKEGRITVRVSRKDGLQISISNEGKRIPEADRHRIFDRFSRLENTINSINRGNGLGLSVSKSLSELLGGTLTLETQDDSDTTFTLWLPEVESPSTAADAIVSSGNETIF